MWGVYDFSIIAGEIVRNDFGNGQYRGFAPVDGGARRTIFLLERDRQRGTSDDVLLDQLAHSELYRRDDRVRQAKLGLPPERVDP